MTQRRFLPAFSLNLNYPLIYPDALYQDTGDYKCFVKSIQLIRTLSHHFLRVARNCALRVQAARLLLYSQRLIRPGPVYVSIIYLELLGVSYHLYEISGARGANRLDCLKGKGHENRKL